MTTQEKKETLLKQGRELLKAVHIQDMGWDTPIEVLDDEHLKSLQTWLQRAEEFMEIHGLECQRDRFYHSSWIINGNRVSVERTEILLEVIESVMVN